MNGECLLQEENYFSIPLCKTDMIDCMDYRIVVGQTEFCANGTTIISCILNDFVFEGPAEPCKQGGGELHRHP